MSIQILQIRPALNKQVTEALLKSIMAGELPKNSYLPPERVLCKRFGVSRTVVREAIKLLEKDGMVRVKRGEGTLVIDAQEKQLAGSFKSVMQRRGHLVEHLMEVRRILEVAVAGLAANRRTDADIAAMTRSLQVMRMNPGEAVGYIDADVEFHYQMTRATHNPTLLLLLEPISDLLRDSRIATFSGIATVHIRSKQHEKILRMIQARNAEGARAAMGEHLQDTMVDLEKQSSKKKKH